MVGMVDLGRTFVKPVKVVGLVKLCGTRKRREADGTAENCRTGRAVDLKGTFHQFNQIFLAL